MGSPERRDKDKQWEYIKMLVKRASDLNDIKNFYQTLRRIGDEYGIVDLVAIEEHLRGIKSRICLVALPDTRPNIVIPDGVNRLPQTGERQYLYSLGVTELGKQRTDYWLAVSMGMEPKDNLGRLATQTGLRGPVKMADVVNMSKAWLN